MSEYLLDTSSFTNSENSKSRQDEKNIPIRIAIYDNMQSIPRIIDINFKDPGSLIDGAPQKIYSLSHEAGGKIPYTIIKEIIENLIHANFTEATITILENGNHIIVSDQGPGIEDKQKAFLPGYTSATSCMKKYIRGVGSGLPIVKETINFSGGSVNISDNIKKGTVVSLKIEEGESKKNEYDTQNVNFKPKNLLKKEGPDFYQDDKNLANIDLSPKQIKILFLIMELEEAGPSRVAKELGFSLSTSYRELIHLEKEKLLKSNNLGKRKLSSKGIKFLEYYSRNI